MPVANKTVYFYCAGVPAFVLLVPASDIPGLQAAVASGSWWSPSSAPNDHINLSTLVRYTIAG